MIGIIYKYTSPSGKIYIGQTTQEKRRRKTFLNLNKSYGGEKIDNARLKYTPQAFTYDVLCRIEFETADEARVELDTLEEQYIKEYDSYRKGYNMTFGGYTTTGMKASEETRRKLSKIRKGRKGTPQTEEQKQAQSERMKLLYADPNWKMKRLEVDKSETTRQKRSVALSGKRNPMFGKKHSEEARVKMTLSRSGEKHFRYTRTIQSSHKEKLSKSLREYYLNNPLSQEQRIKTSESLRVAVRQLTLDGKFVAEYPSPTIAQERTGIDSSCIIKVCKGKRHVAKGFKWEYVEPCENLQDLDTEIWIGTGEAITICGRHRNVLKYHMDVIKDLPFKKIGRKRYVHKPTLLKLYNIAS